MLVFSDQGVGGISQVFTEGCPCVPLARLLTLTPRLGRLVKGLQLGSVYSWRVRNWLRAEDKYTCGFRSIGFCKQGCIVMTNAMSVHITCSFTIPSKFAIRSIRRVGPRKVVVTIPGSNMTYWTPCVVSLLYIHPVNDADL